MLDQDFSGRDQEQNMNRNVSKPLKGILYAGITAALWGVLAVALKVSLQDVSPVDITWFRFTLAFLGLSIYYIWKKPGYLRILRKPPLLLVLASVCLGINYIGFIKGVHLTSPGIAQIFIQTGPVLLAVSGLLFFKEKVVPRQLAGFVLVLAGLLLFFYERGTFQPVNTGIYQTGILWILIAAVSWAVYALLIKILLQRYPPMQLNLVIFGLPALFFLPFVEFSGFITLSFIDWLIMIFLGLNTLVAYGTLSLAIQNTEANKVSMVLILNPILTFGIMGLVNLTNASWIAHEHYTLLSLLWASIVLAGALLSILKPFRGKSNKTG
jgi:drug/metabolite transporter (DMT)-like permease